MDPLAVVVRLGSIASREAAGDGERRAAVWLRDELRSRGHDASLQTVWLRPRWELATAAACALALAGATVSVWHAELGLILTAVALVALAGETSGRARFARLLLPARASQNLVCPATAAPPPQGSTRLVICANLDAGRGGSVYGARWTRLEARLRRLARGHLSAPAAILTADVAALVAIAALRGAGVSGGALSAIQFTLIVVVVVALAALLDVALSDATPGANVNASGVAAAIALHDQLSQANLRRLDPQLLLTGAGADGALGMDAFVRAQRKLLRPQGVIVLAIEPCGIGTPYWLERDGRLLGLRFHPSLRALMRAGADGERHLGARPLRSHGISGAFPARAAGWPAIAVGAADGDIRTPRAGRPDDVAAAVGPHALAATLELCLAFLGRVDAALAQR